jgi:hypothetical protein
MDLGYTVFEGKSEVNIDLLGGVLDLEGRIPSGVVIMYRLDKAGGWDRVDIDEDLMAQRAPRVLLARH